jgi:hypothetical protein
MSSVAGGWQGWQSTGIAVAVHEQVVWRREIVTGAVVAVYSTLLGAAAGPLWYQLAPRLNLVSANNGSSSATKTLIGDDLWLALVAALAGVVCVVLLTVVAPRALGGPGTVVGLAVGGVLGALVAAHIGHRLGHDHIASSLSRLFPGAPHRQVNAFLGYYDFKLRAVGVAMAWPLAAVVADLAVLGARSLRGSQRP